MSGSCELCKGEGEVCAWCHCPLQCSDGCERTEDEDEIAQWQSAVGTTIDDFGEMRCPECQGTGRSKVLVN